MLYEEEFPIRLAALRNQKGVSARDMSLSIGQNPGYINSIENGKSLPSLSAFFYICEFLDVSPEAFFSTNIKFPKRLSTVLDDLSKLDEEQLEHISAIISDLAHK